MVPKPRTPAATEPDYSSARHAKDLLDMIGETVQKKVHGEAKNYIDELKGDLSRATYKNDEKPQGSTENNPCKLQYDYNTNVTDGFGQEYPCKDRPDVRFSDTEEAQCDRKKIRDSNDNEGACAPFRRLNVCDRNLEHIELENITRHNLLVDVCLAAKYEGESLERDHDKYKLDIDNSGSQLCTALARSFADIGDIVRGRDLFRGNNSKDKTDKLQNKLKEYFKKIYNDVTSGSNGKKSALQARYQDTDGGNFFKLREDWWELNRYNVWRAITCNVVGSDYFRYTCSDSQNPTQTNHNCQCIGGTVPTNFDYVPQFLRWFEEWAEDFCRKRKKKLKDVKANCRGTDSSGNQRYCSGDGYNCEKTIREIGIYAIGGDCPKCSFWCGRYKNWIANQKKEFEKQKKKYENVINGAVGSGTGKSRKTRTATTKYEGYDKKFYEILTSQHVGGLDKFLELLNKENECTKFIEKEEGTIDFAKDTDDKGNKTFYHSEYCDECPQCGVKLEGQEWKPKEKDKSGKCHGKKHFTIGPDAKSTDIDVLSFGDERDQIKNKIDTFCKNQHRGELEEVWKCYEFKHLQKVKGGEEDTEYENEIRTGGGLCILQKTKGENVEKQKTFNDFFYFWIGRFLNDSMYWRGKVGGCLTKGKKTCGNQKCKGNCECFLKWIGKKKTEWENIRKHFDTQEDLLQDIGGEDPVIILEAVLGLDELFENIKAGYGDAKELKGIKEMLEKEEKINKEEAQIADGSGGSKKETTIDKLLKHEEDEATKCKNCQPKEVRNACYGKKKYDVVAQQVAQILQGEAQAEANSRGGSSLKGDIKDAKIKNKAVSVGALKGEICSIDKTYSNASSPSKDPCHGKDSKRFEIGIDWITGETVQMTDTNAYMPPRRQHICTSNLEKLDVNHVISSTNVNDTFLLEVLHAAKSEAEDIKNKRKGKDAKNGLNDDQETACRAIRYSFADIGDIIKGTDLWDGNKDAKDLQGHLQKIFEKIKDDPDIKQKYKGDTKTPYKQLREDWWEANREEVWKAMQCAYSGGDCGGGTPYDDYIPQRLRWMVEWAEWYCKAQSQAYGELLTQCGKCKVQGCTKDSGDGECEKCKAACEKYKTKIDKWRKQWPRMQMKYEAPYSQAKNGYTGISFGGGDRDYQQMFNFLKKLHDESVKSGKDVTARSRNKRSVDSATKSPYETIAGYIHQEARVGKCLVQNEFCDKKNGSNNTSYAFKHPPPEYDKACKCKQNTAPAEDSRARSEQGTPDTPRRDAADDNLSSSEDEDGEEEDDDKDEEEEEASEENPKGASSSPEGPKGDTEPKEDICKILNGALTGKLDDACKQKYGHPQRYWGWKCVTPTTTSETTTPAKSGEKGSICVPPRRRKLYIGGLTRWVREQLKTQVGGVSGGEGKGVESGPTEAEQHQQQQKLQPSTEASTMESSTSASSSSTSTENPSHLLRQAFIECAAVETFFLWHNYKERWKLDNGGGDTEALGVWGGRSSGVGGDVPFSSVSTAGGMSAATPSQLPVGARLGEHPSIGALSTGRSLLQPVPSPGVIPVGGSISLQDDPNTLYTGTGSGEEDDVASPPDPQTQLASGTIPTPFLRQMFYTIADYRDILFSGSNTNDSGGDSSSNNDNIVVLASGSDEKSRDEMKKIQEAIDDLLKKQSSDSKTASGVPKPVTKQPSPQPVTRSALWDGIAPQIWHGMICALTYKENDPETEPINDDTNNKLTQDDDLKTKLYDENTKKGKKYHYETVKLEDESSDTNPKVNTDDITTPTLKDFVKLPPYFRYLHEWGTEFCGMRKSLLKNVKDNCRNSERNGHHYCSGDGHDCTETGDLKHHKMSEDPDCPGCHEQCTKYKKWIYKKFEEFDKQKNKYQGELEKLNGNCSDKSSDSGGDDDNKKFCDEIKKNYDSAAEYLKALKHCKNGQSGEEKDDDDRKNEINFDKPLDTFGRSTYCKTCPVYGVNCSSGTCKDINKTDFKKKNLLDEIIINDKTPTTIDFQMIDRRGPYIKEYINEKSEKSKESKNTKDSFKTSSLFKGLRKQNWTCKFNKDENMDVCNLSNSEKKTETDADNTITFKVLLEGWLQDFLYGYYILKKKIHLCTKKEKMTCEDEFTKNCTCVKEWLNQKKQEWESIKRHFNKQKHQEGYDIVYTVKSLLSNLIPRMGLVNGKEKISELEVFLKSYACNCTDSSEKGKEGKKSDIVDCIIKNIEKKIGQCTSQTSDDTQSPCGEKSHSPTDNTLDLDDQIDEENPEENTVGKPSFCPIEKQAEEEQTEETCDAAVPAAGPEGDKGDGSPPSETAAEAPAEPEQDPNQSSEKPKEVVPEKIVPEPKPSLPKPPGRKPRQVDNPSFQTALSSSTLMWSIGISFAALTYWLLKKKTKSPVDLFSIMEIPQNDYRIPTLKSRNRYIPFASGKYRGKRYIYLEGDSGTDSGYTDHYSDITSSSESEYEELDINDIYLPHSPPKYKTLIEVVLEPSKRDIHSSDTPSNKFTDNEWNELKQNFISNMLQNTQNDVPNDYRSGDIPMNTQPNTLYFDKPEEKSFIMSIHDRNLLSGEEYNYDMTSNSAKNDLYSDIYTRSGSNDVYSGFDSTSDNRDSYSGTKGAYSGIDLINDSLSGDNHDIYDELLKRKENELFGTNHHPKHTTGTHNVAKPTNSDPIHNQLELFHKWLDRHRDMCEKLGNKVDILHKLKEKWENDNNSGNKTSDNTPPNSDIPSGKLSDIPSGKLSDIPNGKLSDIPSDNKMLNTDVSIQIHMDNKPLDDNIYLDTYPDKYTADNINPNLVENINPNLVENINPNLVENINPNLVGNPNPNLVENNINPLDENPTNPNHVQIQMSVKNTQMIKEKYPIGVVWNI
ncbi:erythrocyte membrane protein 1, EMP1 [Plasmodium reichenowi]|uniref:Erythrocyte membrane protein 1, EMP1 n=1 Tax=Plasmodium reichenowi TaxID=5854 RepID=A0A060RW63_PLARE|nr:erythrocyte membrane protein 1, EMP1 [Plasmodium reichenowi]